MEVIQFYDLSRGPETRYLMLGEVNCFHMQLTHQVLPFHQQLAFQQELLEEGLSCHLSSEEPLHPLHQRQLVREPILPAQVP